MSSDNGTMAIEGRNTTTKRKRIAAFPLLLFAFIAYTSFQDAKLLRWSRERTAAIVLEIGKYDVSSHGHSKFGTSQEKAYVETPLADEDFKLAEFDWSSVKLTQKANCGMVKCFFESSDTNDKAEHAVDGSLRQTPQVGYLVASQKQYSKMRRASQLASWLTRELGAHHFYNDDAQMVEVTPALTGQLNELVDQPLRLIANKTTKAIYNETEIMVVVQEVIKAPAPALTFGSSSTKRESLAAALPDFCRHVPNITALAEQLRRERTVVYRALVAVPTLWRDFQGMVDVHGNFYFIDLDGHFSKKVVSEGRRRHLIRNRMDRFDSLVEQLLVVSVNTTTVGDR
jgi:hypothetical protein